MRKILFVLGIIGIISLPAFAGTINQRLPMENVEMDGKNITGGGTYEADYATFTYLKASTSVDFPANSIEATDVSGLATSTAALNSAILLRAIKSEVITSTNALNSAILLRAIKADVISSTQALNTAIGLRAIKSDVITSTQALNTAIGLRAIKADVITSTQALNSATLLRAIKADVGASTATLRTDVDSKAVKATVGASTATLSDYGQYVEWCYSGDIYNNASYDGAWAIQVNRPMVLNTYHINTGSATTNAYGVLLSTHAYNSATWIFSSSYTVTAADQFITGSLSKVITLGIGDYIGLKFSATSATDPAGDVIIKLKK